MNKIKNGDIIQIFLPKELGFAYAKYIDLTHYDIDSLYPSMIRVYCLRTLEEINDVDELKNQKLILSPLLISGIQPIIKKGVWKIIGKLPMLEFEYDIPDYKYYADNSICKDEEKWCYIVSADISKKIKAIYEKVKHLENFGAIGTELISTKIAMAFLKDEGKPINKYFELKKHFEKVFYDQIIENSIYYKLPFYMQGKAIK